MHAIERVHRGPERALGLDEVAQGLRLRSYRREAPGGKVSRWYGRAWGRGAGVPPRCARRAWQSIYPATDEAEEAGRMVGACARPAQCMSFGRWRGAWFKAG